jgi:hypothetical protein
MSTHLTEYYVTSQGRHVAWASVGRRWSRCSTEGTPKVSPVWALHTQGAGADPERTNSYWRAESQSAAKVVPLGCTAWWVQGTDCRWENPPGRTETLWRLQCCHLTMSFFRLLEVFRCRVSTFVGGRTLQVFGRAYIKHRIIRYKRLLPHNICPTTSPHTRSGHVELNGTVEDKGYQSNCSLCVKWKCPRQAERYSSSWSVCLKL